MEAFEQQNHVFIDNAGDDYVTPGRTLIGGLDAVTGRMTRIA
jgi:hypothetical protein